MVIYSSQVRANHFGVMYICTVALTNKLNKSSLSWQLFFFAYQAVLHPRGVLFTETLARNAVDQEYFSRGTSTPTAQ